MPPSKRSSKARLSASRNYTEPLMDTPTSARDSGTPLSAKSTTSTVSLPLTPQASASRIDKYVGDEDPLNSARSIEGSDAGSPALPLTPIIGIKEGSSSTPTSAHSIQSDSSRSSSTKSSKLKAAPFPPAKPTRNQVGKESKSGRGAVRTLRQEIVRIASLYLVPASFAIPTSLIFVLTRLLLQPIYNSTPLSLHPIVLYLSLTIIPTILIWHTVRFQTPRSAISARVCLSISALGGDLVSISGRRVGSLLGKVGGAEWGALGARVTLGLAVAGGGVGFAVLCSDYVVSVPTASDRRNVFYIWPNLFVRSIVFTAHVWLGECLWLRLLSGSTSWLVQSPEKSILCLSLLITFLSLSLRSTPPSSSFARNLHSAISSRLSLTKPSSNALWSVLSRLPRQIFPVLLLLRLPLLIIALRQQMFSRPSPPYLAARGQLRVLSSARGVTGQVVVAEELTRGFRYLRCDASILGGRWVRNTPGVRGIPKRTDLGDSIFATFPLQEIGLLAHRTDEAESIARTVMMTTGLQVAPEANMTVTADKPADRVLIIGLGVGIAAQAFSRQNLEIDLVEIDPSVYHAAVDHFNLTLPSSTTVNLLDGNEYVRSLAQMRREGKYDGQKWKYVIQDCFSGGSVPEEMFTREFWLDLVQNVEQDGIVAMNFVGVLDSLASRAVLVTILSIFEQCRAFSEMHPDKVVPGESINMVVLCTEAFNPLLTFRKPTPSDVLRSPLRSHIYSTAQANEIQLFDVITKADLGDPMLMLRRGEGRMDREGWQVASGLSMWYNMQEILTPEMWMAF